MDHSHPNPRTGTIEPDSVVVTFPTRTVSVFVGKPEEAEDSMGHQCPFQIIGIGSQTTQLARGYDSIQALQSALILIAASLNHLNNEIGGKLSWKGGAKGELGFP